MGHTGWSGIYKLMVLMKIQKDNFMGICAFEFRFQAKCYGMVEDGQGFWIVVFYRSVTVGCAEMGKTLVE